jgi:aminoglycoside phosphotransferase (APT) family kinase protein
LHRASVGLIDPLLEGGCLDRRPDVLSGQIAALAADRSVPLPDGLAERLEAAVPRLQELCSEMAASAIPPTLVHGDLHAGNIMRRADRYIAFDWSDACVADPFVDVLLFLTRLPDDPDVRTVFCERYFEAWPGVTRTQAAAYTEIAEPLAAMHHAVTYRGLRDVFGDDWCLFEGALPRWLDHALGCRIVHST